MKNILITLRDSFFRKVLGDKMTWILFEIGIIIMCSLLVFGKKEISFIIEYDEYPKDAIVQIFYDLGNGYHADYVSTSIIEKQTQIVMPEEYLSDIKGIRIDFSNKEGKICIKKIKLQKNNVDVYTLFPDTIDERIEDTNNLKLEVTNERLVINNYTIDGQIYFDDVFVKQVENVYSIHFIDVFFSVFLLSVFILIVYYRKNIFVAWESLSNRKKRTLAILLFIIGIIYSYKDYILGDQTFVFRGIGSDSLYQTYPNLYRCAYLIEKGGELLGFDFTRGYGALRSISQIDIFNWPILFGTENLAYLMGIGHVIKIILAFVLFYIYLKLLGRKEITCYLGAASYSLCGHMVMRQFWKGYSGEVVLCAFLLIALEIGISKKNYIWLPVSMLLYCTTMGEYNSIFIFGLVMGYSVFRYLELPMLNVKDMMQNMLYNVAAYILAILGSSMHILQPLLKAFSSDRLNKGTSTFELKSLFRLGSLEDLWTAFIRTVSMGIEGEKEIFYSLSKNILEGPTFYCGLVMLMLIPFAVCKLQKRRKFTAWAAIIMSASYIIFPNLRYVLNGFGTYSYKLSSFWIIILMLYYGTLGMDIWLEEKTNIKYWKIYLWHIGVVGLTIFCAGQGQINVSMLIVLIVLVILVDYLTLFKNKRNEKAFKYTLAVIAIVDLFTNANIYCSSKISVSEEQIKNMYTDSSIDYIKEIDKDSFYRIEVKDNRTQACVALIEDYYGLVDYSGGTNMNDNIHNFLKTFNIAKILSSTNHYMTGLSNANELYDLLAVKYLTTSEKAVDNDYGLELIAERDGKKIYKNDNMLPIGFCYNSYINEEEMDKLTIQERRKAILDSCVMDNSVNPHSLNRRTSVDYQIDLKGTELPYEYNEKLGEITFEEVADDKVVLLEFDIKCKQSNSFGLLTYGRGDEKLGSVNVGSEGEESSQSFVFTGNRLSFFSCQMGSLSNIRLIVYSRDEYYRKTNEYLQQRKNNEFKCTSFSSNYITGNVNNLEDTILYFAIPYDKGWSIYVDGKEAEVERVNYGFCGVYLFAGNHDIVLKYRIPYTNISIVISILGVILTVMWCNYWIKEKYKDKENINKSASI